MVLNILVQGEYFLHLTHVICVQAERCHQHCYGYVSLMIEPVVELFHVVRTPGWARARLLRSRVGGGTHSRASTAMLSAAVPAGVP